MKPSDMSPERDAYSTRILTLTCMSDFIGIRRLWMSAVFEGIADGHDLRSPSKRVMDELENQVGMLEEVHAIRRLHHLYGYFLDKCMYDV